MAEPAAKKRKTGSEHAETRITDPRFANIQSDPRFRLPGRKQKFKLDKRFSRALKDEDFSRRAKVDRYGRPLDTEAESKRLKQKYEFEEDDEEESDSHEFDSDDEVQNELQRINKTQDLLREGREIGDSSSESSSDEESEFEEEAELAGDEQADVPMGEVSSRLAVVNLDWDNIRAEDLMVVFSSEYFLGSSGRLLQVAIYPSEFGKERMQREELEGPPREIFATNANRGGDESSSGEEDDEQIKQSLMKPDDGSEFDSQALRQYQLDRLRYFYAVLTFSSPAAAKKMYDAIDGTEYLSTANFFDLRFVPDETDFSSDEPREECSIIPAGYKPNEFVTDALQHSKVKLTWDAEDNARKDVVARAFKGSRREIEENDLKAYLASDSSENDLDDGDDETGEAPRPVLSKKEAERQKMRTLLGLAAEPEKRSNKEKIPVGGVQITFAAGLSGKDEDKDRKRSVFENSPEPNETTVEKYVRKEKERKKKRKERMKTAREGEEPSDSVVAELPKEHETIVEPVEEDLGFQDPFFAEPEHDKSASNKIRKEERLKKRREREAEEAAEQKQRAELELLMADDKDADGSSNGAGLRHFDMKEIEKRDKEARRKEKKLKKKKDKKNKPDEDPESSDRVSKATSTEQTDGFKLDAADPRFARLFENHEYAIDPTNPKYKATQGMQQLLEEGRKRKAGKHERGMHDNEELGIHGKKKAADEVQTKQDTKQNQSEVLELVEKLKRKKQKGSK